MKKISIIMAFCLAITLSGCQGKAKETSQTSTAETEQTTQNEGIDVFGEVKVETTREIFIDFPCTVEKIYVKDGQKIKKGDKILTLNLDDYQISMLKKQNEMGLYEGQLNELRQNINPLTSEVSRLKNELNIKQAYIQNGTDPEIKALERSMEILETDLTRAKKEYEVNKEIFDIGGISSKELEDAKRNFNSIEKDKQDIIASSEKAKTNRKLEVNGLAAALKNNEAQLTNTDKQNETSSLELESKFKIAQMDLKAMKNKLSKSYIKEKEIIADTDNMIIYEISCNEGTVLGKGEIPVLKVMDENTLFVSVDIPEEFISKVAIGSEASIIPYADKETAIKGKIIRIADRAIKQDGETIIKADIAIEGEKNILKPGLTVDVKIY